MEDIALTTTTESGDYQVRLEVFSGPMDLLLYLIKKEEVDIYDIPLARITKQYLHYIEMMSQLNLEVAGEFILMAATLIRIKTRLLLPRDEDNPDEPDPREELIMALVEYKKYKEAGDILRDRAIAEEQNYVPPSPVGRVKGRVDLVPSTTLWDLMTAFHEVMNSRHDELMHEVNPESVSINERVQVILDSLRERESTTFVELFQDMPRRVVAVVTFIALLELARTRRISVQQAAPFSQLRVYRGELYDSPLPGTELESYSTAMEQTNDDEE